MNYVYIYVKLGVIFGKYFFSRSLCLSMNFFIIVSFNLDWLFESDIVFFVLGELINYF